MLASCQAALWADSASHATITALLNPRLETLFLSLELVQCFFFDDIKTVYWHVERRSQVNLACDEPKLVRCVRWYETNVSESQVRRCKQPATVCPIAFATVDIADMTHFFIRSRLSDDQHLDRARGQR